MSNIEDLRRAVAEAEVFRDEMQGELDDAISNLSEADELLEIAQAALDSALDN